MKVTVSNQITKNPSDIHLMKKVNQSAIHQLDSSLDIFSGNRMVDQNTLLPTVDKIIKMANLFRNKHKTSLSEVPTISNQEIKKLNRSSTSQINKNTTPPKKNGLLSRQTQTATSANNTSHNLHNPRAISRSRIHLSKDVYVRLYNNNEIEIDQNNISILRHTKASSPSPLVSTSMNNTHSSAFNFVNQIETAAGIENKTTLKKVSINPYINLLRKNVHRNKLNHVSQSSSQSKQTPNQTMTNTTGLITASNKHLLFPRSSSSYNTKSNNESEMVVRNTPYNSINRLKNITSYAHS